MHIETQGVGTATVVTITGDVDPTEIEAVSAHLIEGATQTTGPLIVDLSGVTFLDAGGAAVMLTACEATPGGRRDVRLVITSPGILSLFGSSAEREVSEIYESMQGAVDRVARVTIDPVVAAD